MTQIDIHLMKGGVSNVTTKMKTIGNKLNNVYKNMRTIVNNVNNANKKYSYQNLTRVEYIRLIAC